MGTLAQYLQAEFVRKCPTGWICRSETRVLPTATEALLGYSPRVDVLLEHGSDPRRLWVEFEVSRADPVANHAKFATAHMFCPQPETDTFVSMVSSHVARGRQNLSANAIYLMRNIGMRAFQTVLLPTFDGPRIKELNHLPQEVLQREPIDIVQEITRIFMISSPLLSVSNYSLHYAGNHLEVLLNLYRWNQEVQSSQGQRLWGKRTVTFFVYDRVSQQFAPSKFCAYVAVRNSKQPDDPRMAEMRSEMSLEYYATLQNDRRFDGRAARSHLVDRLGMMLKQDTDDSSVAASFNKWLESRGAQIRVHPQGPIFIVSPDWFT